MRQRRRITLLALAGACLLAAGCGSDDEGAPIPPDSVSTLEAQLANVQARLDNGTLGACEDISGANDNNVQAVEDSLNSLPDDVDQDVRDALVQGFDRLFELVGKRCDGLREDEGASDTDTTPEPIITDTQTEPTTPTETETETEPATPTETETETVPPADTETTPPAAEEPPADDGGGTVAPEEGDG